MKCIFCKEEIADNAIKCKHCNEFVNNRFRILKWLFAVITLFIPLLSLMLAGWQTYARTIIEQEKNKIEEDLSLTQEVLDEIPSEVIMDMTLSRIEKEITEEEYEQVQQGNFDNAEQMVQSRLEKDPDDERSKKDLIYLKTLKKKQ